MQLVTTVSEVAANIAVYQEEVGRDGRLRTRIAKTIWWYAAKRNDDWIFAPSKFVGYVGMTAEKYLANFAGEMDGRDTEKHMKSMFVEILPGASAFAELKSALEAFTASHHAGVSRRFKGFRVAPDVFDAMAPARRADEDARIASRIVSDPGICGGRPRIRGTRMRVADIMQMLAAGMSAADIVADFPYISTADVAAALAYGARAVDHSIVRAA